jgi:hypothetical protein
MRRIAVTTAFLLLIISCGPPPPIGRQTLKDYRLIAQMRGDQFRSAAYLIDLRVDDDGERYSVNTELYFSCDSVGFYGRGYLGKGAFRGQIINDTATILFSQQNEYFSGPLADIGRGAECASPGEVLLVMLSFMSGRSETENGQKVVYPANDEIGFRAGRFEKTARLDDKGYPHWEKLIDTACGDSIVLNYYSFSRAFPFYRVEDVLYYNELFNFRARGFIREQKYNIDIGTGKFTVEIPPEADRLKSL